MVNNITNEIKFAIQQEMLLCLYKSESISDKEYTKALNKLREKNNCKLIVTSPNF